MSEDRRAKCRNALRGCLIAVAVAFPIVLFGGADVFARSAMRGPGPFSYGRFRSEGLRLVIDSDAGSFIPLSGEVSVSATRDGVEWIPFDRHPDVNSTGDELLVRGSVDGIPVDEFFSAETQRRLLVRNGDGAEAEVDLVRIHDEVLVWFNNPAPTAIATDVRTSGSSTLDATKDSTVTLSLAREKVSGVDLVVGVTAEPPPAGVLGPSVVVTAVDTATSKIFERRIPYGIGVGPTTFHHFLVPEGRFDVRVEATYTLGNPLLSVTTICQTTVAASVDVSRAHRLLAVPIASPRLPALVDATVSIDGIAGLEPTFSNRYGVALEMTSDAGELKVFASRNVGDGDLLRIPVRLAPGRYVVRVSARREDSSPNGVTLTEAFDFAVREIASETVIRLPRLVPLTGALVDPDLILSSTTEASNLIPTHVVAFAGAEGEQGFGMLRGASRVCARLPPVRSRRSRRIAVGDTEVTTRSIAEEASSVAERHGGRSCPQTRRNRAAASSALGISRSRRCRASSRSQVASSTVRDMPPAPPSSPRRSTFRGAAVRASR